MANALSAQDRADTAIFASVRPTESDVDGVPTVILSIADLRRNVAAAIAGEELGLRARIRSWLTHHLDTPGAAAFELKEILADVTAPPADLLAACKAQHAALDMLLAQLATLDKNFMPSTSPAWPAVAQGFAAIKAAEGGDG